MEKKGRGGYGKGLPPLYLTSGYGPGCAKAAEPIDMPGGKWTRGDPSNHVLGGGPVLHTALLRVVLQEYPDLSK